MHGRICLVLQFQATRRLPAVRVCSPGVLTTSCLWPADVPHRAMCSLILAAMMPDRRVYVAMREVIRRNLDGNVPFCGSELSSLLSSHQLTASSFVLPGVHGRKLNSLASICGYQGLVLSLFCLHMFLCLTF